MISIFSMRRAKALLCAASISALALTAQPVMAQSVGSQQVSMDAMPLDQALVELARRYGISTFAPRDLTRGKRAPRISGNLTAEQAIRRALSGSGLTYRRSRDGGFVIVRAAPAAQAAPAAAPAPEPAMEPAMAEQQATLVTPIIVTGTKLSDTVQDSDASVEIFDAARLDREQLIDVGDIFLKTPNVSSRGGAAGTIAIRGIGRGGVGGAGQGVTSNIYVDGAPLSGPALGSGPTSLWDVQQVEVLRGPQSSVQGRNALAGAVIVNTADPTYDYEGKARFTYGSFDTIQAAAALSGPIIKDQLAARIAVDYQDTDGFITNVVADRSADRRESLLVRGKLLFEPEFLPDFTTKLTVDYSEASLGESRPIVSTNFGGGSPLLEDFDFLDYEGNGRFPNNDIDSLRIISESTYTFSESWLVRAIITNEETRTDRLFGVEDDFDAFEGLTFNEFDVDIFSAELRFEFDYDNVRGLVGGYYYDERGVVRRDIQARLLPSILPLAGPLAPLVNVDPADSIVSLRDGETTDTENFAFFGQLEWDISPKWTLNLGFRYDYEEFQQSDVFQETGVTPEGCLATVPNALVMNPALGPFDPVTLPCGLLVANFLGGDPNDPLLGNDFEAFLPRVALTYNITEDNAVFASYQRGYRAGGSNVFAIPNPDGIGNIRILGTYEPEFLDTFEIGTRNKFLDGKLTFNANIFYSIYTDQQLRLPGNLADTIDDRIDNVGETTLYGAEFLIDYSPNRQWNIFASVGYLQAEFDDFPFAVDGDGNPVNPTDPRFANLAGNEVPGAPDLTFTLGVNYEHPSGFFGNVSFSYIGEQFAGVENLEGEDFREAYIAANAANPGLGLNPDFGATLTELIDDRTDLTIRIGYEGDNFTIFGFVTNLLNTETLTDVNFGLVNQATGQIALSPNETFATVNTPRAFGAGIDVRF
ncbi:MAG: TonB-dependent receptor [Pseudomonadota bacterium]